MIIKSTLFPTPKVSINTSVFSLIIKAIIFLTLLFGLQSASFGQGNFKKGYIVTLERDTIPYQIDYRSAKSGSSQCIVKDGSITKYKKARSILAFGFVNGNVYESSSHFNIAQDSIASLESEDLVNHVFYEVLAKGEVSLYRYKNEYFAKTDRGFYKLFIGYKTTVNDRPLYINGQRMSTSVVKDERVLVYKTLLENLFSDCNDAVRAVKSTTLTDKSLKKVFKIYNQCKGVNNDFISESLSSIKINFAPEVRFYSLKPQFSTNSSNQVTGINEASFSAATGVAAGLSIFVNFPKTSNRFSFKFNVSYSKIEAVSDRFNSATTSIVTRRDSIGLSLNTIDLTMGIQFEVYKGFYALAGGGYSFISKGDLEEREVITDVLSNPQLVNTTITKPFTISEGAPSFHFGIGYERAAFANTKVYGEFRFNRLGGLHEEVIRLGRLLDRNTDSSLTGLEFILGLKI